MVQDRAPSMLSKTLVALGKTKEDSNNNTKVETPSLAANSIEINTETSITNHQAIDKRIKIPDKEVIKINKLTQTLKNFSRRTMKI